MSVWLDRKESNWVKKSQSELNFVESECVVRQQSVKVSQKESKWVKVSREWADGETAKSQNESKRVKMSQSEWNWAKVSQSKWAKVSQVLSCFNRHLSEFHRLTLCLFFCSDFLFLLFLSGSRYPLSLCPHYTICFVVLKQLLTHLVFCNRD